MAKSDIVKRYEGDLERISKERSSLSDLQPESQNRIDELKSPIGSIR